MTHALLLGEHVAQIVAVGFYLYAHIVDNLQTIALETYTLHGIVGDETHFTDTEQVEYLSAHAVVALIGLVAEMEIGVYGVEALFLELVGLDFLHEANAASLLVEIER